MNSRSRFALVGLWILLTVPGTERALGDRLPRQVAVEVYKIPSKDMPQQYTVATIPMLLRFEVIQRFAFDPSRGVPASEIQTHSEMFRGKGMRTRESGFIQDVSFVRHLLPEFYQKVGGLEFYLVRRNARGKIVNVIAADTPEKESDLFRMTREGDTIVAQWFF